MQRTLDALGAFCEENGLTVSTKKTKWLLGGTVGQVIEVVGWAYQGQPLEQVAHFKYLGLEYSGEVAFMSMVEARLVAAMKAFGVLQSWGSETGRLDWFCLRHICIACFCLEGSCGGLVYSARGTHCKLMLLVALAPSYHRCLCSLLGVGRDICY